MDELYANLIKKHATWLDYWDAIGQEATEIMKDKSQFRLQRSHVILIAHGHVGLKVATNLLQTPLQSLSVMGVGEADVVALQQLQQVSQRQVKTLFVNDRPCKPHGLSVAIAGKNLLVAAVERPFPQLFADLNKMCLRVRTAWLPASLWGVHLSLGPTVFPGITACHHCATRRLHANYQNPDVKEAVETYLTHDKAFSFQGHSLPVINLAAAYITAEVEKFLTGYQPPVTLSRLFSSNILTMTQEIDHILPLAWCPVCHPFQEAVLSHANNDSLTDVIQRINQRQEVAHS